MSLKNRGAVKKRLRGRQRRKAGAVVWQWEPTFKEAVPLPSPPPPKGVRFVMKWWYFTSYTFTEVWGMTLVDLWDHE